MKLNEEKSKLLFQKAGLPVPAGERFSLKDLSQAVPSFPPPWVLKVQILSGGRGKAGGIQIVETREDFVSTADRLLQTPIKGEVPPALLVEPKVSIQREMYISLSVNRTQRTISLTTGRAGGVEIEQLGAENLLVQSVHSLGGIAEHQIRTAFFHLGLERDVWPQFRSLVLSLARIVFENGALLAEVNPLVLTGSGDLLAVDGKVELDDNMVALSKDLAALDEPAHRSPEENRARAADLSYVRLQGWVGLMVNGAGLAMTTMDQLNFAGLPAANFLDLGGAADEKRIATGLDLLFQDSAVRAVLINIFGGILSCEKVASAFTSVLQKNPPQKPVVLRLAGHGAEAGHRIVEELSSPLVSMAGDLTEAMRMLAEFAPEDSPSIEIASSEQEGPSYACVQEFPPQRTILGLGSGSPVLVQGITGREGRLHTALMQEYGTNVVAGVTPFKGGTDVSGIPVYDSVHQATRAHQIGASIIFVPAPFAPDAIEEAAEAGIPLIVCITEGVPQTRMLQVLSRTRDKRVRIVGPNTPGIMVPGMTKLGIMPGRIFRPGPVAVLSRSGTLTYEAVNRLTGSGIGQSLCLGVGGDPFVGLTFEDMVPLLEEDEATRALLVLGEIGGTAEEDMARAIVETGFSKPVFAFIAGQTAPPGKRLGHAGAILGDREDPQSKLKSLQQAGCTLCPDLDSLARMVGPVLSPVQG